MFVTFAATEVDGSAPHRLHPREGHGRASRSASASTRWACAATTCASCTTTASASRPRTCSASPARASGSPCRSSTTAGCRLGTGSVGGAKFLLDLTIDHVKERKQFGRPLADFELVQDKIGWMVSYLFGLESMAYLTSGLVDQGVQDYSLESAICKVAGTEFLWYAANRALQLKGGAGYMRDEPYEKLLRDIRIFPIFEGANDVMRAFIALSGMKPLGERAEGAWASSGLGDPIGSIGVLADYVAGRIAARGAARPDHARARRARRPRRTRSPTRSSACARSPRASCASTARDRGAPVPPEAAGRRRLGRLRADRGALARDGAPRGARRGAVRAGALHRRDLLHARRARG